MKTELSRVCLHLCYHPSTHLQIWHKWKNSSTETKEKTPTVHLQNSKTRASMRSVKALPSFFS